MTSITAKVLTGLATTLVALLAFIAAYSGKVTVAPVDTALGAVATLDGIDSGAKNISGRRGWESATPILATSSAFCVLKNPLGRPVVVNHFTINMTTNTFGAIGFDIATSSNGFATSSVYILGRGTISAVGTAYRYSWVGKTATTTQTIQSQAFQPYLMDPSPNEGETTRFVLGSNEFLIARAATTSTGGGVFGSGYSVGNCSFDLSAF